jgi:hypothetical protein
MKIDAAPRPVVDADWWRPKSATCTLWVIWQRARFGGLLRFRQNRNVPYTWRGFWSPDGREWYSFVPTNPKKPGIDPWYCILLHIFWFEGGVRKTRAPMPDNMLLTILIPAAVILVMPFLIAMAGGISGYRFIGELLLDARWFGRGR